MSVRVMSLCWGVQTDTASLLTLLALADHANDAGAGIYPGNKRLSHKVGMSVRQVQRVLRHLEEHGLISRAKYAAGGHGHAVEWVINSGVLERVTSQTPFAKKGDICDRKGCHLSPERVTWVSPQPSGTIMKQEETYPQIQREPGEKWGAYLARLTELGSE